MTGARMGVIKRYRTAWSRFRRSHGFGIHSPFAFRFVLDVLCERLPYYAYAYIDGLRQAVVDAVRTGFWNHPRVISAKNAKMLFRLANYFNPRSILQVGTSYGVSSACMMVVNSNSRVWLYEPHLDRYPVVGRVLQPFLERVEAYNDLSVALNDYDAALEGDEPFVLINDLPEGDDDLRVMTDKVRDLIDREAIIVMRNLSRSEAMRALWDVCREYGSHGQLFTNDNLGVIVARRKLQREEFSLWF